ncbi:MAG: methionine--tRNA ligase [Gemmatimonadales bacterium]
MTKLYLTTAIDYSNGDPHLGHAYEKIGADCIARYRRLAGDDVHFVIGMDENSQNVVQAAEQAGQTPRAWVDLIAGRFRAAWERLAISHDDFIRTTEPRHAAAVRALLERIRATGGGDAHIYEGVYRGYYCTGCEAYKRETELLDGRCPLHPTRELTWLEEPNYFFRLSAFRDRLLAHYDAHPDFLRPPERMNEVRNMVADGLEDISISRARLAWGIPFPGAEGHTVYVWFDALINYLSATEYPAPGYDRLWPADLHVIGPDITRFHCVIWPAMLMAAGVALPRAVWAHGWMTFGGARFSKSAGVRYTLDEAIERHGPDALRYFLLREVPWDASGEFSLERFDARYTADLADTVGNLVSRTLSMVHRYSGGAVPDGSETPLDRAAADALAGYRRAMDAYRLHDGAARVVALAADANRFVQDTAPWTLAKRNRQAELDASLAALVRTVARIAVLAAPFLPGKAEQVWTALGAGRPLASVRPDDLTAPAVSGRQVGTPPILFPKLQPSGELPETA